MVIAMESSALGDSSPRVRAAGKKEAVQRVREVSIELFGEVRGVEGDLTFFGS